MILRNKTDEWSRCIQNNVFASLHHEDEFIVNDRIVRQTSFPEFSEPS